MTGPMMTLTAAGLLLAMSSTAAAQITAEDVSSPEAIVAAAYEEVARRPGENYNWNREVSLYLPSTRMYPNTEQTDGEFRPMSVEEFRTWAEEVNAEYLAAGNEDKGFVEEQIHAVVHRYGDIAHVMSTYQKHFWGSDEILGRGINSFQLVRQDGRWWIVSIAWDEETGAGPIPAEYLPAESQ